MLLVSISYLILALADTITEKEAFVVILKVMKNKVKQAVVRDLYNTLEKQYSKCISY
jgi:hypothetical protein